MRSLTATENLSSQFTFVLLPGGRQNTVVKTAQDESEESEAEHENGRSVSCTYLNLCLMVVINILGNTFSWKLLMNCLLVTNKTGSFLVTFTEKAVPIPILYQHRC